MSWGQGWVPSPAVVAPAPDVPAPLPKHPAGLSGGSRTLPTGMAPRGRTVPTLHSLPSRWQPVWSPSVPCHLGTASGRDATSALRPAAWQGASIPGDSTLPGWGDGALGWAQGWGRLPAPTAEPWVHASAPQPPVPIHQGRLSGQQGSHIPCPLPAPCPRLPAPTLFVTPVTMARERLAVDPPLPPQATVSYS